MVVLYVLNQLLISLEINSIYGCLHIRKAVMEDSIAKFSHHSSEANCDQFWQSNYAVSHKNNVLTPWRITPKLFFENKIKIPTH